MGLPPDDRSSTPPWKQVGALMLLTLNIIPLVGVLSLGWSLFTVMALFWLENVVIGVCTYVRVRLARLERGPSSGTSSQGRRAENAKGFAMGFTVFTTVHGIFIVAMFAVPDMRLPQNMLKPGDEYFTEILLRTDLAVALAALLAVRGFDLYVDYLRPKAYLRASASDEAAEAGIRILVLQGTLLGGAFLIKMLNTPIAALVVLVILKTIGDAVLLYLRHRRHA